MNDNETRTHKEALKLLKALINLSRRNAGIVVERYLPDYTDIIFS